MTRYVRSLPRPAHLAHRGGSAVAPENTLPAFRQAVERWRADALELDVQPAADGAVMVIHDDNVDRTTNGRGPVASFTRVQLQELDAGFHLPEFRGQGVHIPALEEVLAAFPGVPVNVELKDGSPAFLSAFARVVREAGALERVCVGHLEEDRALALRAMLPECATWFPQDAAGRLVLACLAGGELPRDLPWDVLAVPREFQGLPVVTETLVRTAHRLGKLVHVWTVDEAPAMEALLDLGVDGIMTDRPDVLRAVLEDRATRLPPRTPRDG